MNDADPYAQENFERLLIDLGVNAVEVLILAPVEDAQAAYGAAREGDYVTAVLYVGFTVCDVAKPCKALEAPFKGIVRASAGLRKAQRAGRKAPHGNKADDRPATLYEKI